MGGKLAGLSRKIKDYKKLAQELEIGEITLTGYCKGAGKTGKRSA